MALLLKNLPANVGDIRDVSLISRVVERKNDNVSNYSGQGNSRNCEK